MEKFSSEYYAPDGEQEEVRTSLSLPTEVSAQAVPSRPRCLTTHVSHDSACACRREARLHLRTTLDMRRKWFLYYFRLFIR